MLEHSADVSAEQSAHPRAGETLTGAEIIVEVLAQERVRHVFGYSGGAILPTFDAVFRYNANRQPSKNGIEDVIEMVVPANEQGAAFMASGYARASGEVGVVMVTSGPGATNTVTSVRDCMADSTPIVVLCGQVPTTAIGTDAFQEAPVSSIMGAACKHVFLVTEADRLEATLRTAFELARSGRPGPVVVDIPKNVQTAELTFAGVGTLPIPGYRQRMARMERNVLRPEQIERFFNMLRECEAPLLYVGGGVINGEASEAVSALARECGIPVVTTLMGIGAFDTTDDLSLHMLGMHGTAFANYAVEDCDFLIAVGSRFDDRVAGVPSQFAPKTRHIAHFDIDVSEINKVKAVDWHHVGVLRDALRALVAHARATGFRKSFARWHEHVHALKTRHAMNYDRDAKLIQPYHVIEEINRHTKGRAIIATGVGQHQMWAAQYFDFCEPRLWLTSGSMGTMGFGLPAAIGAQFADPERLVIDIDGDASIRMNLGDLETVTTYDLPVKVVVLNNFGDGMVKQWQKLFFKGRLAASDKSLHKKDFVKAAQADGYGYAVRLDRKEDLPSVVAQFVAYPGPAFLEVIIDPDAGVYPMVGPGMSYAQMVTGEHIVSRDPVEPGAVDPTEMF
ncbi:MAG: biosynthetic-type acetolactate synthase large subunit [Pseudomonadota bacterium]